MNLLDFHGIESEKAYAMKMYNDRRTYLNILRAVEAIAAVALIGYWWLPTAMIWLETADDWIRRIVAVLDNHCVVFILINVLIISIVVLSREKSETESDLYDQYTAAATEVVYPAPVMTYDDRHCKHIVPVKTRIESTSAADWRPEKTVTAKEEDRVVYCGEEEKRSSYRRTQSERRTSTKKTTTMTEMRRVEYRRSESAAAAAAEKVRAWGSRSVERLSSEEFRVTVERFIMEKKTLMQENDVVVPRRGHNGRYISDGRNSSSALVRI